MPRFDIPVANISTFTAHDFIRVTGLMDQRPVR